MDATTPRSSQGTDHAGLPLVSILIPCHNAGPWVAQTLESVLAQTYPRCEVIVVNDGSTDDSADILRRYESRGIRTIHQAKSGQSAAFNRALEFARGDYLEFLDADDLLAPDKIELQVTLARTLPPERIISGAWGRFYGDPASAVFRPNVLTEPYLAPVDWLVRAWTNNEMMHGAAWLIPAAIVRKAGPWNPALSLINDFDFFARQILQSDGVQHCAAARTYYRSGVPGSLSASKSDTAWRSAFTSITEGTGALLQRESSPRTRQAAAMAYQVFYYDAFPAVPELREEAAARIRALGHSIGPGPGGAKFQRVARIIGWPAARRVQLALWRLVAKLR